jgi:general secretion pathway protein D
MPIRCFPGRRPWAWQCVGVTLALAHWLVLIGPVAGQQTPWLPPAPNGASGQSEVTPTTGAPAEPGYQAYPLQQLDAASAGRQLQSLLSGVPSVDIVVDPQQNRLLVRGSDHVHQMTRQLLAKLDRVSTEQPRAELDPLSHAQIESYPLADGTRDVLMAWQQRAAERNDIRVAIDQRTGQALVLAPPTAHAQIRAELSQSQPPAGTDGVGSLFRLGGVPADRADTSEETPSPVRAVRLRYVRPDELRERLERLLARPLAAGQDASGQWQSFTLEATPGAAVTAAVNLTTGDVRLDGPADLTTAWRQVIEAVDSPPSPAGVVTQLVSTNAASQDHVRDALAVLQNQNTAADDTQSQVTRLFQPRSSADNSGLLAQAGRPGQGGAQPPNQPAPGGQAPPDAARLAEEAGGLLGPVQIEFVEGLDVIVIRGSERDVQRVMQIINQIEQLSQVTVPAIEVYQLQHASSEAMGELLAHVYSQVLLPKFGDVSITALVRPNAILVIGRTENVQTVTDLIRRLDQPVEPTSQFQVFPLKHASAADAKTLIDSYLGQEEEQEEEAAEESPSLAPRAMIVADHRTNSLIVNASPRNLAEIAALVERIDAASAAAVDQVRVFPLTNAVATDLEAVIRGAIQAQATTDEAEGQTSTRASALEFKTIGTGQTVKSGVLTSVRVTADARANALVVAAPAESMDLIAALIAQLDRAPDAVAELKVFRIVNGDALGLAEMLRTLFGSTDEQQGQEPALGGLGQAGLVRMQFSVDARTNSIIAAGTRDDLAVVEAILWRLDEGDIRERLTVVYRLKNAFAQNVADALNLWLQTRRETEQQAEVTVSPFEQIEREVIIVPEIASNSLIVSATPRYYEDIKKLIDQLDERPPMVMIQVMIAEVRLNDTDEFGVELGLQDSLLFDRSLLSDVQTITTTTQTQTAGGATISTVTEDQVINANLNPGFNFNNQPLGNNGSTSALATAASVAAQGLSNFDLGRTNGDLNFGGFVFSASSSGLSVLLRALQENRRLEVLSRPQIMALDGQAGIVQVGQQVPRITATSLTQFGQTNSIIYEPVGLILHVVPRISPDGLVVMQVEAIKSEVGVEAEGIPISVSATGEILRAPRIDNTQAITTVSALSGQTVVLSGLLTTRKQDIHRRVPLVSDIPLIGDLFRYDSIAEQRTELLIILTPRIITNKLDAELVKQVESSRMSWILSDVVALNGESGLRSRCDDWCDGETEAVYPNYVPEEGELLPSGGPSLPSPEPTPAGPQPATGLRQPLRMPPLGPTGGRDDAAAIVTPAQYGQYGNTQPAREASYPAPTRLPQTTDAW